MPGKLFERRYFHSDSGLVPSGEGPPVTSGTSGDCLLSISGLFAEVASRSLCSHAIMKGLADHRSSSPRMKMKTAEEFKIEGWVKCVRQITCSQWTGLEVACMLLLTLLF